MNWQLLGIIAVIGFWLVLAARLVFVNYRVAREYRELYIDFETSRVHLRAVLEHTDNDIILDEAQKWDYTMMLIYGPPVTKIGQQAERILDDLSQPEEPTNDAG